MWYITLLVFHNVNEQQRLLAVLIIHAKSNPKQTWGYMWKPVTIILRVLLLGVLQFLLKSHS